MDHTIGGRASGSDTYPDTPTATRASSSLPSRPCPQPCGPRPSLQEEVQGHPSSGHMLWGSPWPEGTRQMEEPPPHLRDPVSGLRGAEEQGFRVVEGTRTCVKRAWVSGVILPVTRAFHTTHSVPAQRRGRELECTQSAGQALVTAGPATLPYSCTTSCPLLGRKLRRPLDGLQALNSWEWWGAGTLPTTPVPTASHTPSCRGTCGPHYTGLRPHGMAPQTRHTGQSVLGA